MDALNIEATTLTPRIQLDFQRDHLQFSGESFPEDVHSFYAPVFARLQQYLQEKSDRPIQVDLEFTYVNSASTRSLQQLLTLLDKAAGAGRTINVRWIVCDGDDALTDLGDDLLHDKRWLRYNVEVKTPG